MPTISHRPALHKYGLLAALAAALWLPTTAAAIVVPCPNGFNQCDPYSGTCYTAWTATLAGQVQAQCAADPSSCWTQSLTTCPDIPPPVNPNAVRVCPPLADCGPGYPPNPGWFPDFGRYPHLPGNPPDWLRAEPGTIETCWTRNSFSSPAASHRVTQLDALTCRMAEYWFIEWPGVPTDPGFHTCGQACQQAYATMQAIGRADYPGDTDLWGFIDSGAWPELAGLTFEAPPSCPWAITPAPTAVSCEVQMSVLLATYKDNATQLAGLDRYYNGLRDRIDVEQWALNKGLYGSPMSKRYAAHVKRVSWLINLMSLIVNLVVDPPNPAYASFPPLPPAVPLGLPTSDITLSPAELAATTAWLTKVSDLSRTLRQLTATMDNLGGAILAAEAGTPGAAAWVRPLALASEAIIATAKTQGLAEVAARYQVVSQTPSVQEPAGCSTPTDAANFLKRAVSTGSSLYQGHLVYQTHQNTCGLAQTWPNWLTQDAQVDIDMWTAFAPSNLAAWLCTANVSYCAATPVLTPTPADIVLPPVPVLAVAAFDLRITNSGTAPLIIGVIGLQGGTPAMFQLPAGKNFCQSKTLLVGASCLVRVRFVPTAAGSFYTKIRIPSNDPATPVKLVRVTGVGQ